MQASAIILKIPARMASRDQRATDGIAASPNRIHMVASQAWISAVARTIVERIRIEDLRTNGYGFQIELNHRCARARARIKEIPFFFVDRRRGTSKLSWRIGFEALWVALRLRIAGR